MTENNSNKKKSLVSFRVKPEEYDNIHELLSKKTYRILSEYARKVLLNKSIIVKHRNESAAEVLTAMIKFKNELNPIGSNFN